MSPRSGSQQSDKDYLSAKSELRRNNGAGNGAGNGARFRSGGCAGNSAGRDAGPRRFWIER